jgi:hypothetical protein
MDDAKLERAKRLREKAVLAEQRSVREIVRITVRNTLAADAGYAALTEEAKKLRGELHVLRLNWNKKNTKLRRLLRDLKAVTEALEQVHAGETAATEKLERVRAKMEVRVVAAKGQALQAVAPAAAPTQP